MTYEQLISLCDPIDVSGPEPDRIGMLEQDSRKVGEHAVFIAIKGFETNGHQYIDEAIGHGAAVIICEDSFYTDEDVCVIEVENTRTLIGPLAQAFADNPADDLSVIGITGTNGKTTVATLVYQVLNKLGAQPSLLGTVTKIIAGEETSSRLTTADPIELAQDMKRMVESGSDHLVMEVSSHALDQQRVNGINFEVAAFTNLSHDHLDYHDDLESYATAKKRLFDGLGTKSHAVINADDEKATLMSMDCHAHITDFSFKKNLQVECQVLSNTINGLAIRIGQTEIESPLVGTFNAYNIAEAYLVCCALGFSEQSIADILSEVPGAPGRLERVEGSGKENPVVLVDYSHTPDALKNVASTLAELKEENQKLHIVFGCGGNRDKTKRPEMAQIAKECGDHVTVTSDNPRDEKPERIIADIMEGIQHSPDVDQITNRKEAIELAIEDDDANTMILVAGKGHETYQEVAGERHHFDDREIARNALQQRHLNEKAGGV